MKIHIVQKGDTLWELSKQYGVDFEELKQANSHLASPDMIMPGMKIKIPSTTKAVKKETVKKEQPKKKETQMPYKDVSPKPMPVLHEDKKKEKVVKPEMPLISPQLPVIDQDFQFNFTQMPSQPKPKEEVKKKEVKKEVKQEEVKKEVKHEDTPKQPIHPTEPLPQPQIPIHPPVMQQPVMHQPMPQMMPCCYYVPCYPPMHYPMHYPMMPDMFMAPAQAPVQQTSDDCGCGGGSNEHMPSNHFYPEQDYTQQQPTLFTDPQTMNATPFPADSAFHYPTPPNFPGFEREEEEDKDNN